MGGGGEVIALYINHMDVSRNQGRAMSGKGGERAIGMVNVFSVIKSK